MTGREFLSISFTLNNDAFPPLLFVHHLSRSRFFPIITPFADVITTNSDNNTILYPCAVVGINLPLLLSYRLNQLARHHTTTHCTFTCP